MKIFTKLLSMSIFFTTCSITIQNAEADDVKQESIVESLLPTQMGQEIIKHLDKAAIEEANRITAEEARPATGTNAQQNHAANLKLRAELIRQEILTMNIMKAFAVTASIASFAAGAYIFLLILNK